MEKDEDLQLKEAETIDTHLLLPQFYTEQIAKPAVSTENPSEVPTTSNIDNLEKLKKFNQAHLKKIYHLEQRLRNNKAIKERIYQRSERNFLHMKNTNPQSNSGAGDSQAKASKSSQSDLRKKTVRPSFLCTGSKSLNSARVNRNKITADYSKIKTERKQKNIKLEKLNDQQ